MVSLQDGAAALVAVLKELNAANWIAVGAASISVATLLINNSAANKRDRLKGRREEFNKQIVAPFEKSVDEFQIVIEEVYQIAWNPSLATEEQIDSILLKARKAQGKISRAIRKASSSDLTNDQGWTEIGQQSYDDFIESLAILRDDDQDKSAVAFECANSLEGLIDETYDKIYRELRGYI